MRRLPTGPYADWLQTLSPEQRKELRAAGGGNRRDKAINFTDFRGGIILGVEESGQVFDPGAKAERIVRVF